MSNTAAVRGTREGGEESGFALILAILALMLLTFLGLTLATSTSTELQIATNYRWSQQAYYNAEAGLEYGKALLRNMNWTLVLPEPRMGGSEVNPKTGNSCMATGPSAGFRCWWLNHVNPIPPGEPLPGPAPFPGATRNYENSACDTFGGGMGYGVVLYDGSLGPFENMSTLSAGMPSLNGTTTIWIRREYVTNTDGSVSDAPAGTDVDLVLTAEGTAPYTEGTSTLAFTQQNRAVRILQATLRRTLGTPCGTRGGQVGGGPEGSNFSPCDPITGDSLNGILGGGPGRQEASIQ